MSDSDRPTDPDSLHAMQAAIRRVEDYAERAANYSFQAFQEAKKIGAIEKRVIGLEWREHGRAGLALIAIAVACLALLVACGMRLG